MAKKHEEYLVKLREAYDPFDITGAELAHIDELAERLNKAKDPEYMSFREHPMTMKLYQVCVKTYKASCNRLMNDEGTLKQDERIKLGMSKHWALWFIKSLGGDPKKIKKEVEREIEQFAEVAGLR